ncbi:hypothetical protein [Sphingomonas sp. PAMC 26605]|uniref:hypothetical protein n=1 Tax=Sphingomonas sp. PAMC 26605 TaxID=1112214 RepID=UPI00026CD12C|nr:hypothetical protein [Sphingomonas sp. PAMC 26605]
MKTVRSDWSNTILVCKKCSKKLGGGFGAKGKTGLAKAPREELGVGKGRKGAVGIIEVKCLGVCPRGSVTVVNGAAPGTWLLVEQGLPAAKVAAELGLGQTRDARVVTDPNEASRPDPTELRIA